MAKKKLDPKVEKWQGELTECLAAIDKQESRIIRTVNKLANLRTKRKRLERSIALQLAENIV